MKKNSIFNGQRFVLVILTANIIILLILVYFIVSLLKSNLYYFNNFEKIKLQNYNVYGESINVEINDTFANEIDLINIETKEKEDTIKTEKEVDKGITPNSFSEGRYYLEIENKLVESPDKVVDVSFTSTTKNGQYYKISIRSNFFDILELSKERVANTFVCDVMIDAGHGGKDSGTVALDDSYEKDYTLSAALELKKDLEDLGYNVCLTRDTDINPGFIEGIDYIGPGGRVYQFYENQAKYGISIHFNADGSGGYQVYTSVKSTLDFAKSVASAMKEEFRASKLDNEYVADKDLAILQKGIEDEETNDYFYIIRETGGLALGNYNMKNQYKNNIIGTQTLLLELGYLDNEKDLDKIQDEQFMKDYIKVISQGIDEYIQSQ